MFFIRQFFDFSENVTSTLNLNAPTPGIFLTSIHTSAYESEIAIRELTAFKALRQSFREAFERHWKVSHFQCLFIFTLSAYNNVILKS